MLQPRAMSTHEREDFHLGRGLLHGVLGFAVFTALGMAFAGTGTFGGSLQKLAETVGRQGFWALVLSFLASYGFQTSRRTLGSLMLLVVGTLFVFHLYVLTRLAHAQQDADAPLTAAEKRRPAPAGSGGRVCQPALAFSFPSPGPGFAPAEALERQVRQNDPYLIQWIWEDRQTGDRLHFQVAKGAGRNESAFRAFAAGIKREVGANPGVTIGPEELLWTKESGELEISATAGDRQIETRCLSRGFEGETPPIVACAQTTAGSADGLRQVRTGLSLAPCGTAAR
ncbi:MAG TPA: hypothetical protein VKK31_20330 [Thermoanaerobaculia bacterium]|nr:hypothetical protein [Thermoanaerobaculia bacterium]